MYTKLTGSFYIGLSTDTKPSGSQVAVGSRLIETDTSKEFIFNSASSWSEFTPRASISVLETPIDIHNYIWNPSSLAWEAATGSLTAGNNVTIVNFPASYPITNANLDTPLSGLLKPADTLTKVSTIDTITNQVAVTNGNLDAALSSLLKPADTLTKVSAEDIIEGVKKESSKAVVGAEYGGY